MSVALPAWRKLMAGIQPNDRVVVRTGYAQDAVGVVRHVYECNGELRYSVDYDAFVFHEHDVYAGGDDPEASLEPVMRHIPRVLCKS